MRRRACKRCGIRDSPIVEAESKIQTQSSFITYTYDMLGGVQGETMTWKRVFDDALITSQRASFLDL